MAVLLVGVVQASAEQYLLFDLEQADVRSLTDTAKHRAKVWDVTIDDRGIRFDLAGDAGSGKRWFIPIKSSVAANSEVEFGISSDNISNFQSEHNVYLRLRPRPDPAAKERPSAPRTIPLFTAAGRRDNSFGRTEFTTADGAYAIEGIYVDLAVAKHGRASLWIEHLRIGFQGNLPAAAQLERILSVPPPVKVTTRPQNVGGLAVFVNEKPVPTIGYSPGWYPQYAKYSDMSRACSIRLHRATVNLGGSSDELSQFPPLWTHPEYFDYELLGATLKQACPTRDDYLIIDVMLQKPPEWWGGGAVGIPAFVPHAGRRRGKQGSGVREEGAIPTKPPRSESGGGRRDVCDLDPEWREYCKRALRLLLAFIREQPTGANVIGCNVIFGAGWNDRPPAERESHPAYSAAFCTWLHRKYSADAALRDAWENKAVTIDAASPAPMSEWPRGRPEQLIATRIPGRFRDSIAFYNDSWMQTILHFARFIKTNTHGRYLTGLVNGPALFMSQLWNPRYAVDGGVLRSLLTTTDIDYVEIPASTLDLRLGAGLCGTEFLLADILRSSGKLLIVRAELPMFGGLIDDGRTTFTLDDTIQALRRLFAAALLNQAGLTLFQTDTVGFNNPYLLAELERFVTITSRAHELPMTKYADLAFAVDTDVNQLLPTSLSQSDERPTGEAQRRDWYYGSPSASWKFYLLELARATWNQAGLPFDVILIDDLDPSKYRTIVFYHVLRADAERLARFARGKSDERTLIWVWADGCAGGDGTAPDGLRRASGIDITRRPEAVRFQLDAESVLLAYLGTDGVAGYLGWQYAHREPRRCFAITFGPKFTVTDEAATVLARYAEGGEAALAMRRFEGWTSIYSASPVLNPELLRAAAKDSGAHVYLESNDISFINASLIGFHTTGSGSRVIRLPYVQALYELFRDQELPRALTHRIEIKGSKTYLFFRGTKEEWLTTKKIIDQDQKIF